METKVVNIKYEKYDVYIGRAGKGQDGYFGNPHTMANIYCSHCQGHHDRDGAIEAFRIDFLIRIEKDPEFKRRMLELKGKRLGCFCAPYRCHGDIYVEYLEKKDFFTGVGSRELPDEMFDIIKHISKQLNKRGYSLRSGHADGADMAFEVGYGEGYKEIYIPWRGFNKSDSKFYNLTDDAFKLASTIHPAWNRLTPAAKKLHARNCFQVLGQDLKTPSKLLICWTKDGKDIGGTRTAIVLAKQNNIPVFNIALKDDLDFILRKFND